MILVAVPPKPRPIDAILIEGYASRFEIEDRSGDTVRAGAFSILPHSAISVPMLLQHKTGNVIGRWTRLSEDGRGLFVRGLVETRAGITAVKEGLTGLSIGFRPRLWTPRQDGGRTLIRVELVEISLVKDPMLDVARFERIAG